MKKPPSTSAAPCARGARIAGRSHRDFAFFCNCLLPVLDCVMLLAAGWVTTRLFFDWFRTAELHGYRWDEHYVIALIALLASVLLYDKRFVAVASRGHVTALVRCYLTGILLLASGVLIIGIASGILYAVPVSVLLVWLATTILFTAITRVLLAVVVEYSVRAGWLVDAVAVVGIGTQAARLVKYLERTKPVMPYLLGVFDDLPAATHFGDAVLTPNGSIDDLIELGKVHRIDWIFLALPRRDERRIASVVNRLKALSVPIALCPSSLESNTAYKMIDYIGDHMPIALIELPAQTWPARVRALGQFLPRWITTLLVLFGWALRSLWFQLTNQTSTSRLHASSHVVCELDDYDLDRFAHVADEFGQQRFGYAVTPNVDHLIRLHDDVKFRSLYAGAEFILMDSRFLNHLLRMTGRARLPICTGSDLTARLLANSQDSSDRIVIVGGSETQVAALTVRYRLKNLAHYNPPMGFGGQSVEIEKCLRFVEAQSPFKFCLLALGSPQQELLANELRARGLARGLALCVGASIDFLTGVEKRAPRWMQNLGFEWLYRLVQNPRRLAGRYLIRGPRIFWLLRKTTFVLRAHADSLSARAA